MQLTSGLLMFLGQRFGAVGLPVLILVLVALVLIVGSTVLALSDLLAMGADPVQVAPVRWWRRY